MKFGLDPPVRRTPLDLFWPHLSIALVIHIAPLLRLSMEDVGRSLALSKVRLYIQLSISRVLLEYYLHSICLSIVVILRLSFNVYTTTPVLSASMSKGLRGTHGWHHDWIHLSLFGKANGISRCISEVKPP